MRVKSCCCSGWQANSVDACVDAYVEYPRRVFYPRFCRLYWQLSSALLCYTHLVYLVIHYLAAQSFHDFRTDCRVRAV